MTTVLDELRAITETSRQQRWLVRPLLQPGRVTIIGGPTNAGKSMLAKHLAVITSFGTQFLDPNDLVADAGDVIHVIGENSYDDEMTHYGAIIRGKFPPGTLMDDIDRKRKGSIYPVNGLGQNIRFTVDFIENELKPDLATFKPPVKLLIIDLIRLDEHQIGHYVEEAEQVVLSLASIAHQKDGPAVLITANTTRGNEQAILNPSLERRADASFLLEHKDDTWILTQQKMFRAGQSKLETLTYRSLTRDADLPEARYIFSFVDPDKPETHEEQVARLQGLPDQPTRPRKTGGRPVNKKGRAKFDEALIKDPTLTPAQLAKISRLSKSTCRTLLRKRRG